MSELLGVLVSKPGGTPGTAYSGWSDPLGVVVGPNIEAIEPAALGVGAVAEPVTLYGQGLAGVDSLIIEPADGITLSAPEAAADGGMVTAYVSVAADAVHGLRRIVPSGTDQPYRVVVPGADLLNITPPQPIIDALEPNYAVIGTTGLELTLRGRNLGQATAVSFDPADGIAVGSEPVSNADGKSLSATLTVAADVPAGPRIVTVTTPAGSSSTNPSGANTFHNRVFLVAWPEADYRLNVHNGGLSGIATSAPVTAGEIVLNGLQVVGPRDFNKNSATFSVLVDLEVDNELAVELRGTPVGLIVLDIEPASNIPPVADAGADQSVFLTETVLLDGSGSIDINGDRLNFLWSFAQQPQESGAALIGADTMNPSFVVDGAGTYTIELLVDDGEFDSDPDRVIVSTLNAPPVADAGADQTVFVADTVQLDGSASRDLDGAPLGFGWTLADWPGDSTAVLQGAQTAAPTFFVDRPGQYLAVLVVNGGGDLAIRYAKPGWLPVQRIATVPTADYALMPDVALTGLDPLATVIELGGATTGTRIARGRVIDDSDGERGATVLFPSGTTATYTRADGSVATLERITLRATEYTVGPDGPSAMPGELPAASGYTYAVELSADEALADGTKVTGKDVVFNQPVSVYVDNFIGFLVGGVVPVGYYDSDAARWVASDNGRVIKVLSVDGGSDGDLAELDLDGSGVPADSQALAAAGITDEERARLAAAYPAGTELWRFQTGHLSTWDCNWPYGPPDVEPHDCPSPPAVPVEWWHSAAISQWGPVP